ncbi:HNH endonuclease signature motif containing protein [Variovorax sp. efr-133-TYG-130]|uniref:HNH endonuclease n=1 Tax=Variovorax sp. efr-133-TYG-130 TaxID=3040327 RepID=UPI0025563665|nr:HNH endonuclease signature motif containing protein [Variovorax sp. efr-133-TYG-130]
MRKSQRQRNRERARRAQRGTCIYCCRPMGKDVTAEHLVARMDGGKDSRGNIVAACRRCNAGRHALFPAGAPEPETYQAFVLLMRAAGQWPPLQAPKKDPPKRVEGSST